MKKLLLLLSLLPFASMAQNEELWRVEVQSPSGPIPVHLLLGKQTAYALNSDEKHQFDKVTHSKDSTYLTLDLYDLEIVFSTKGNNLNGYIRKKVGDTFKKSSITGTKGDADRFKSKKKIAPFPLAEKYQITFKNASTGKESPAIGVFENTNGKVNGTFVTTTGDYRYLQGNVIGDSLYLSALGLNAYLYKAKISGDSLVGGEVANQFGKYSEFSGTKNASYTLPDASKLTYLKEGFDTFNFTFPDTDGKNHSLTDTKGKVTVVQILGTWCPNCLDETKFLMDYKSSNPNLQVIGLAFERSAEPSFAHPKIKKFIERFKVDYPVLLAGKIEEAAAKLPQLNHVMAFPTSIIVDKKGNVRKIHTGFSGPGTGSYYTDYVKEFTELINKLEKE